MASLTGGSRGHAADLLFIETEDQQQQPDSLEGQVEGKTEDAASGKQQANQSAKVRMHAFLSSLASCVSRDHCDKAAVRFATGLNSKANRTRLVRTLVTVPRNRLDLLPFCARSATSLPQVW